METETEVSSRNGIVQTSHIVVCGGSFLSAVCGGGGTPGAGRSFDVAFGSVYAGVLAGSVPLNWSTNENVSTNLSAHCVTCSKLNVGGWCFGGL